ncbi:MAG: aminopeptidase N [Candidatus Limnocylindrales bacterium]
MTQTAVPAPQTPARDLLTQSEARARAAQISDVAYTLVIDIAGGKETYLGDCTLTFTVSALDVPLFIDFLGRVESMSIDGEAVEPRIDGDRLVLEPGRLRPRMSVRVRYENRFDSSGDGLHRFVDPEDGEEYLYSNFQPFDAHRMFPCFDQPDLKATYDLTVIAPSDWAVVSAGRETAVRPEADGRARHEFERTARFSTYLLALVAGPYHSVHRTRPDGIVLGLYARRSMAPYLDSDLDEIFEITSQGFDFYAELFDQPYAFVKYDQLYMPEFNIGAMENVGAVTFSENFLFRDPPTETQRQERGEVILHELAHMWFGNLVTMRWWNDLWLNESFASYISYLALTEATRFTGAWKSFHTSLKRWAYRQDQLQTTHPISGEAPDTDSAFLNFDGITYGKGASVLKQLVATIGPDSFRDGMRLYFKRHAWGNATLADFLAALEVGSGRDLGTWARLWLESASVNTIAAHWQDDGQRLTSLRLEQSAPADYPILRPHALRVGLLSETTNGSGPHFHELPVELDGPQREVAEAVGLPRPMLVFPNHDDHAYAKVDLDPISLAFAGHRMAEVQDPLLRELLWMSLWEMVRDGGLRSTDFLGMVHDQLVHETDPELLEEILGRTQAALRWFVPEPVRETEAARIVRLAVDALPEAADADARITWLRAAIAIAATAADLEPLIALADGNAAVAGVTVDQRMRWDLAIKAVAFGTEGAEQRVAMELERDASDRGQRARIRAEAARPDAASKAGVWERINGVGYGSFHLTRAAMEGFHWPSQADLLERYEAQFFQRVREIFRSRDHSFATAYLGQLFPDIVPDAQYLERGRRLLAELEPEETLLRRGLQEELDDLARALRVRAMAETEASATDA